MDRQWYFVVRQETEEKYSNETLLNKSCCCDVALTMGADTHDLPETGPCDYEENVGQRQLVHAKSAGHVVSW